MQVECPVCLEVMLEPCIIECCTNNICYSCILRLDKCPLCRSTRIDYCLNTTLQKSINDLRVFCSHRQKGCDWIGRLTSRSDHVQDYCPCLRVECGFEDCEWVGLRQDKARHIESCSKTRLEQLKTTIDSLHEIICTLSDEKEELKAKIARLKPPSVSRVLYLNCPTVIGSVRRRIDDYDRFEGNSFYIDHPGYKIQLLVDFKYSFIEVYIRFVRGRYDDQLKWPFQGSITVELVHPRRRYSYRHTIVYDRDTYTDYKMIPPSRQYSSSWGTYRFISTDEFRDFVTDDRAVFKVIKVEP